MLRNNFFDLHPWDKYPFSCDLRRLSSFRTVIIEVECEAIEFEDFDIVDRGPIEVPWDAEDDFCDSARHVRMVSGKERAMEELRVYLQEMLGNGVYYTRRNFRCLTFYPQSTYPQRMATQLRA